MRSCCGRSGSIVVGLRHQPTPLYTSGHTYTQFRLTQQLPNVPTAPVGRWVSTANADKLNATTKKPVRTANISADISSAKCCHLSLLNQFALKCEYSVHFFFNNTLWETWSSNCGLDNLRLPKCYEGSKECSAFIFRDKHELFHPEGFTIAPNVSNNLPVVTA